MPFEFLPRPKHVQRTGAANVSHVISSAATVIVNKAKLQDAIMDFFGYLWKQFKINLKITPINDRDFRDEFESLFFMYITSSPELPTDIMDRAAKLEQYANVDAYLLEIDESAIYLASKTASGIACGIRTLIQLGTEFRPFRDQETGRASVEVPSIEVIDESDFSLRAVHVDLKRQLHSLDYLKDHVRLLSRFKINAIFWEWEDKFPYRTRPELRHQLAFEEAEAAALVDLCTMYGIESIPLVQTFGHLEFVLKHQVHRHLKETRDLEVDPANTLDICPLQEGSLRLISDMIGDVVRFHPRARFFHVGGDEVYSIGTCAECRAFIEEQANGDEKLGKSLLYTNHMNAVAAIVKGYGKIPMIWHDYLLKYPSCIDQLDHDFVIAYWEYGRDANPSRFEAEMQFFVEKGFKVVVASSVRSEFQYAIPNYADRLQNVNDLHAAAKNMGPSVIGCLATSWACCHSPMETTIPALILFAEAAWNYPEGHLSTDAIEKQCISMLRLHYGLDTDRAAEFGDLLWILASGTTEAAKAKDPREAVDRTNRAFERWSEFLPVVMEHQGEVENIIHGLRLLRLRGEVYMTIRDVLDLFDVDRLPVLSPITRLQDEINRLDASVEAAREDSKKLYEKVMYDEEVATELSMRFERPLSLLHTMSVLIATIVPAMNEFGAMDDAVLDTLPAVAGSIAALARDTEVPLTLDELGIVSSHSDEPGTGEEIEQAKHLFTAIDQLLELLSGAAMNFSSREWRF
jgi:hypothetical protein